MWQHVWIREKLTLVSYIPKSKSKKKNVVLISSMHQDKKIDEATGEDKKPEIITFYNSTKGDVDVVNMMMNKYSVSRNSRCCPLTVFFALLNISYINSYVLHVHSSQNKLKRCTFIKKVNLVLLQDTLRRRLQNMHLPKSLRAGFSKCYPKLQLPQPQQAQIPHKLRQKEFCPRSKDRKVKSVCSTCKKHVCSDHSKMTVTCTKCENADISGESDWTVFAM